jgi:lysylphosphatidylglycerol synthetase-like protein (DUF2156 family)
METEAVEESAPSDVLSATEDRAEIRLPVGSTVIVCSDLHLAPTATEASRLVTAELSERLRSWTGPGAVILNGGCFDPAGGSASVTGALDAHGDFADLLGAVAGGDDRHLVVTVDRGQSDKPDTAFEEALRERIGVTLVIPTVDVLFESDDRVQVVRVEHGHHTEPGSLVVTAASTDGSPLPAGRTSPRSYLADARWLSEPGDFARYLGSRVVYREIIGRIGWLVIPVLMILLAVRAPVVAGLFARHGQHRQLGRWLVAGSIGVVVDAAALGLLSAVVIRRVFQALAGATGDRGVEHPNEPSRAVAEALCSQGFAGYVAGHTRHPELTPLPGGFYANTGCGVLAVEPRSARVGLPPVFDGVLRRSWVELQVERSQVRADLVVAETPVPGPSRIERLAAHPRPERPDTPTVVASVPGGAGWPIDHAGLRAAPQRDRDRRIAAALALVATVVNVLSAVTPPARGRLRWLLMHLPVEVSQVASATIVFASLALLALARGLRRGHRVAWLATMVILVATVVLHVAKGGDVEEAVLAAAIAGWLAINAGSFRVRPDAGAFRRVVVVAAAGAGLAVGVAYLIVIFVGDHNRADTSVRGLAERLGGRATIALPGGTPFVAPALTATGIGLAVLVAFRLLGPRRPHRSSPEEHRADQAIARRVVAEHGGDTLAYFALRDDKDWFFTGSSVVAYSVRNGVCLVSPDPIGPSIEWTDTWTEFSAFADRHGWPVAVVGAQPAWLPIYEAAGMRAIYMGDEAIVNCQAFTLAGGDMKSLRGGYNRVRKAGYHTIFLDPADIEPDLKAGLEALMTETRQGETERGFSMTLSRIFDPDDRGLMLSVAVDDDGRPAAFCQWAPAADVDGWSLDLMRRGADPDLPNGLTDFVVIDTIEHLKANGQMGLCLNFAVMRAVVAGEREGTVLNLERKLLHKFSESMQIESLWRYNDKYQPYWRPRYAVIDAVEHAAAHTLAIVDAEGVAELPVIGRFLGRHPA